MTDIRYTKPNRLADVITLISVLSIHEHTFRSQEGLEKSIQGKPMSGVKDWIEVAKEHPEFFRPNDPNDPKGIYVALLLRSYFEKTEALDGQETRKSLTIQETQKLIDAAISLHDKEIARTQKDAYKTPIKTAIIAGVFLVLASIITSVSTIKSNNVTNSNIDSLQTTLHNIESKLNTFH